VHNQTRNGEVGSLAFVMSWVRLSIWVGYAHSFLFVVYLSPSWEF